MTRKVDFLLVGGGLASATAAEALRLEGAEWHDRYSIGGRLSALGQKQTCASRSK
jgi:hypothetical protein